eukprot:Pgem_evm1s7134
MNNINKNNNVRSSPNRNVSNSSLIDNGNSKESNNNNNNNINKKEVIKQALKNYYNGLVERIKANRKREQSLSNYDNVVDVFDVCNRVLDVGDFPTCFFALTSNVDEHLLASGFDKKEIFEIHGNTEL